MHFQGAGCLTNGIKSLRPHGQTPPLNHIEPIILYWLVYDVYRDSCHGARMLPMEPKQSTTRLPWGQNAPYGTQTINDQSAFLHCSFVIKRYVTLISCLIEEPNAKDDNDLNLWAILLKFLSAQCYFILQLSVEAIGSLK